MRFSFIDPSLLPIDNEEQAVAFRDAESQLPLHFDDDMPHSDKRFGFPVFTKITGFEAVESIYSSSR
ncbi:hypothetical protein [Rubinisphaera margarita]|uniref:hypothetical protein n=1 Tax=Rubinisphaera margarita TaxID=2909586 RepID=UPI001EE93C83|nr:hypothetical protein [Rubinisphaera margarita]MCG6156620.1 hypothetical protein [Rubinisphaera margarita]